MLKRVDKLLIGKDIDRTAAVAAATSFATVVANLVDGEVVVLDKNKLPLAAGSTVADTDVIYICQGTSSTFDYAPESGAAVTGARKVIFSDPIEGKLVKSFKATSYVALSQQTTSFTLTGLTVTAGVSYLLRVVYKDIPEHPGQFTQTYRYIAATGDAIDDVGGALADAVNAHTGARISATYTDNTDVLLLTAKAIPENTSSLNDLDIFSMVEFDAYLNYVNSAGNWAGWGATESTTAAEYGSGNWEQVRDMEKAQLGYRGVQNITLFPIVVPDMATSKTSYYDSIVIESDKSYLSPDNAYVKQAPLTTVIALATANTGINANGQAADILAVLNPWMASLPGAFNNVSI